MSNNPLQEFMGDCNRRLNIALDGCLPLVSAAPFKLHEAMRYSVFNGGKRLRPILVYATGHALGVNFAELDGPACAVELIHCYSLIHDDLPAMDDDDLRRGKLTSHKVFGEAMAILAGDALHSLAFNVLCRHTHANIAESARLKMVDTLSKASGSLGMAGGQAIDMTAVGDKLSLAELENMHAQKTGELIRASVVLGALCQENVEENTLRLCTEYAKCIGLAFQIKDDILDIEAESATLGKTQGQDMAHDKPTYPSILGLQQAHQSAAELRDKAISSLSSFGASADPLRWIADYIVQRSF